MNLAFDLAGDLTGGSGFNPAYLDIYATATVTWDSTTWEAVTDVLTIVDNLSQGISRVDSDFTFDTAGTYLWICKAQIISLTTATQIGFRLRDVAGAITKANTTGTTMAASVTNTMALPSLFTVTEGQVLQLQYCKPAVTALAVPAGTFDGDPIRHFHCLFSRVA